MKTIRLALVTLLIALPCIGLNAQSLVGTWECSGTDEDGDPVVTTLTFNEDGTFTRVQTEMLPNLEGQTLNYTTQESGKWKLVARGKRIFLKYKPSSVQVDSEDGNDGFVKKILRFSKRFAAMSTLYFPKILSLTETELTLMESYEDDSGPADQTYTYDVEVTYTRKN